MALIIAVVHQMYERYLNAGANDKSLLVDVERGYKLVGGQSLLQLNSLIRCWTVNRAFASHYAWCR